MMIAACLGKLRMGAKYPINLPEMTIPCCGKTMHVKLVPLLCLPTTIPTAFNYLLLRAANLTIMQIKISINEWVKKLMVQVTDQAHDSVPLIRTRKIVFGENKITISDRIRKNRSGSN